MYVVISPPLLILKKIEKTLHLFEISLAHGFRCQSVLRVRLPLQALLRVTDLLLKVLLLMRAPLTCRASFTHLRGD